MEVIFDTHMLKPVLSPTMKTALSVLGLIGRSLVEANKCMKERVAAEAGQPPTLDDVMKQSGLHIPGLEEALAQFMGGGDEAKKAAALVVNTPDPVTLLNRFAAAFGVEPATAPIVTPPPASAANAAPASATGPLAAFRADFTPQARDAARAAAPSSEPPGLPLFRQDFTREARDAARAAATRPAPPQPATPSPTPTRAAPPSLVAGVKLRLDALRGEKQAHEATVSERITRLEARLAALHAEWRQYCDAKGPRAEDVPVQVSPPEGPASAKVSDWVATDEPASALAAPSGATGDGVVIDEPAPQPAITPAPADAAIEPEPLPTAASTEEVVQAFELIDEYAEQARAADEQQLARIAALEQDIGRMEGLVQHARAAQEVTAAHAQ
jgi:hypothetical protein